MNKLIQIIITVAFTVLVSCNHSGKGRHSSIQIEYDTLTIDIEGSLGQIIKFKDNYYCFFERSNPYSSQPFKDFYVLSSDGKIKHRIDVPEKLNYHYSDLHVRNDSIITKVYMDHYTFYFDPVKLKWIEIEEADDMVFEDERYYVTYLGFGEFGSTVWFKDKTTKKEYEFSSYEPTISRIKGNYYLSNSREVFRIDPQKMMPCDSSHYYKAVESITNQKYGSPYINGGEYLFKDTTNTNPFDSSFLISTSFAYNDSMLYLCVDGNRTYLATIDSGEMNLFKDIGNDIHVYKYHYSYRGNQFNRKNQLLKFHSKDWKREGLIEINDNIIRVVDVINNYTPRILGKKKE